MLENLVFFIAGVLCLCHNSPLRYGSNKVNKLNLVILYQKGEVGLLTSCPGCFPKVAS